MNLLIVSGSQRKCGQSTLVAQRLLELAKTIFDSQIDILELADYPELLWKDQPNKTEIEAITRLRKVVSSADAFAIISPEYGGMAPPLLKNFFLQSTVDEIGYKPAFLIATSAGQGGAYPIFELRGSAFKNNKIVFIPDQVIIRNVDKFNNDGDYQFRNQIYTRLLNGLNTLHLFGRALLSERNKMININSTYSYGM